MSDAPDDPKTDAQNAGTVQPIWADVPLAVAFLTRLPVPARHDAGPGALARAGSGAGAPFFTIADTHRMRIFVEVPQGVSSQVRPGMQAELSLPEYPARTFTATLVRDAGAVNAASGTVRVELETANPDGLLKPGAYAEVELPVSGVAGAMQLPGSALIIGADGPTVAVVDGENHVAMRSVVLGRDQGSVVEIMSGLDAGARVVDSPPETLLPGDEVRIVAGMAAAPRKG